MKNYQFLFLVFLFFISCKKKEMPITPPVLPVSFSATTVSLNGSTAMPYKFVSLSPIIKIGFSAKINTNLISANVLYNQANGIAVSYTASTENGDSILVIRPASKLVGLTAYSVTVSSGFQSQQAAVLPASLTYTFTTGIDSVYKFPVITDSALLTLVQQQTFKYFWDFGHPTSGLARERNISGDLVTSGGSGFGIMAIPVAIKRNFIPRNEGLLRMQKIVGFLKNTAQTFHGAYPHWLNGISGAVIPFSTKDNGADLVETSYLMEGLLTARQYFNGTDVMETTLRSDINFIWNRVEWNWFRQGNQNTLFWHWSPSYNWEINLQVKGWNEALMTYVLAASSNTFSIPKSVYDNGWAAGNNFLNGNTYLGYILPLGPALGGPLFFEHYSFMGINPIGLSDGITSYSTQTKNHTLINYNYTIANPKGYYGYSDSVWGLTASDIQGGYTASSPTNDIGTIAPTAALSSFPYTPLESMKALKFFYYVLGDKIWKEYGFVDAFSLNNLWFANSFLAIDQGPIIVMIENYRSGQVWNLFTSCPEVKAGLIKLGFTAPYL